jgi:exonuclease VII small subunit
MSLDYKKLLKEMEGLTVEQLKSRILALEAENDALKKAIEVYKKNLEDVLANKEAKFREVKQKC